MRIRVERGVCREGENPVRALLYQLLVNEQRKERIETQPIHKGGKVYSPDPEFIIDRVLRSITIKKLGDDGVEYRFWSAGLQCDIRVIANSRLHEDFVCNPYTEADAMLSPAH